ncbi:hypothetical protein D3C81_1589480 [compost metagenome]
MVSVVKQDGRQNDGCELMDIQHRIQPVILSSPFLYGGARHNSGSKRLKYRLYGSEKTLDYAFAITSKRRGILNPSREAFFQRFDLTTQQFSPISQYGIRDTCNRPVRFINLYTKLLAKLDLVSHRHRQSLHCCHIGGILKTDVKTGYHAAKHINDHIDNRATNYVLSITIRNQIDISYRCINLISGPWTESLRVRCCQ